MSANPRTAPSNPWQADLVDLSMFKPPRVGEMCERFCVMCDECGDVFPAGDDAREARALASAEGVRCVAGKDVCGKCRAAVSASEGEAEEK